MPSRKIQPLNRDQLTAMQLIWQLEFDTGRHSGRQQSLQELERKAQSENGRRLLADYNAVWEDIKPMAEQLEKARRETGRGRHRFK